MIVGHLFGIPITTIAIYCVVVRPLLKLGENASPNSLVGKVYTTILTIALIAGIFVLIIMAIAVCFLIAAS